MRCFSAGMIASNITRAPLLLCPDSFHAPYKVKCTVRPRFLQYVNRHRTSASDEKKNYNPENGRNNFQRKNGQKEERNMRTSEEVTQPSTTLAQARLTSEFPGDLVL